MAKKRIPADIKEQALQAVSKHNETSETPYDIHFRGAFAYLERTDYNGMITKIGRLEYLPDEKEWDFAVFRYSREIYDPDEWIFPGVELLDGTIEGAMKAGMLIYPA